MTTSQSRPFSASSLPSRSPISVSRCANSPGLLLAAVEQRDLVSARLQRLDEVRTEEPGAAEEEHAQLLALVCRLGRTCRPQTWLQPQP